MLLGLICYVSYLCEMILLCRKLQVAVVNYLIFMWHLLKKYKCCKLSSQWERYPRKTCTRIQLYVIQVFIHTQFQNILILVIQNIMIIVLRNIIYNESILVRCSLISTMNRFYSHFNRHL